MTYLEQLLGGKEVEWKPLGEVCKRTRGTHITALRMKELHKENAPVKVFAGGKTVAYLNYEDLPAEDIQNTPSIIVKSRGIIEFEYYDGSFSHKNEFWAYHSENRDINIKFIYYFLKTQEPRLRRKAEIMGTIPQIALPDTERLLIPVPPLAVQEKIVEILDKYTALETELEKELAAELEARKKQYEYYRNKLMRFGKEVEWKPLGEVCVHIFSGRNQERDPNGAYPVYGSTGIIARTNQKEYNTTQILVARVGVNAGYVHIATGEYAVSDNTLIVQHKEILLLRFLYYFLTKLNLNKLAYGGAQPLISASLLKKQLIPIPPLAVQEQIVEILDKFHTLVHSISEGLPAEIALRRRQYEYYRNLLLRFPPPQP